MTILVSDSFNRTNSTTTLGSTDSATGGTSKTWQALSGTWGISSNQAYLASSASDPVAVVNSGISDNFSVSTTFSVYDAGARIVWRCIDSSNYWIVQGTTIWKKVSGGFTSVGSFSATITNGDIFKVSVSGNVHTAYINGTQVLQVTDSANSTGTNHGIGGSAGKFDDFQIDSLTGGSSVSGGGTLTGTGTLTATGLNTISKGGNLTGLGSLTASGRNNISGASALTGTGTLSASGRNNISGSSSMQGVGSLTVSGTITASANISGSAALQGNGTLTATGTLAIAGGASLQATGTLLMRNIISGGATLTGVGTLTCAGIIGHEILDTITLYASEQTSINLSSSEELTVNLYALETNSVTLGGGP